VSPEKPEKEKEKDKTQKSPTIESPIKLKLKVDDEKTALEKIKITTVSTSVSSDKQLKTYVIKKPDSIKMSDLNVASQSIVPVNRGDSKSFNVKLIKVDPKKYNVSTVETPITPKEPAKNKITIDTSSTPITLKTGENGVALEAGSPDTPSPKNRVQKELKKIFIDANFMTQSPIEPAADSKPKKNKKSKESSESLELEKSPLERSTSPIEDSNDNSNMSETSPNTKRNMRSQNAEFSLKQQKFLKSINTENETTDNSDDENTDKMSEISGRSLESRSVHPAPKVCLYFFRSRQKWIFLAHCEGHFVSLALFYPLNMHTSKISDIVYRQRK
jgi:hypothetical protein